MIMGLITLIEEFLNLEYDSMGIFGFWSAKKIYIKRATWLNYLPFDELNDVFWWDIITGYGASDREDTLKEVKSAKLSEVKDFFRTTLINDASKKTLILTTS